MPDTCVDKAPNSGIRFKVHSKNLACSSSIFADMLEVGTESLGAEVTLVEPASVVARMLPFTYPIRIIGVGVSSPGDVALAKALTKYEVSVSQACVGSCSGAFPLSAGSRSRLDLPQPEVALLLH